MTDTMVTLLSQQNVTNNHHECCVTSKVNQFYGSDLEQKYLVLEYVITL